MVLWFNRYTGHLKSERNNRIHRRYHIGEGGDEAGLSRSLGGSGELCFAAAHGKEARLGT
jgi:hypothetical protein